MSKQGVIAMPNADEIVKKIQIDGYVVIPSFMSDLESDILTRQFDGWLTSNPESSSSSRYSRRNLLVDEPIIRDLAANIRCQSLAELILGQHARPREGNTV